MRIKLKDFAKEATLKNDSTAFRVGREIDRKLESSGCAILDFEEIEHMTNRFSSLLFFSVKNLENIEEKLMFDNGDFRLKELLYRGIKEAKLKKNKW